MSPIVKTYQLIASNGKPVRKATKVIYPDGTEIKFMERLSKRDALAQGMRRDCE